MACTQNWHITIPLLLHSGHVDAGRLIRVCKQWNELLHDSYRGLGPFHKLSYIRSVTESVMTTRLMSLLMALLDNVATFPTADKIAVVLVSASSECYWSVVGSVREDGRLWMHLNKEWGTQASKYRTHALAISNVINKPRWLSFLRARVDAGILTPAQFTNIRLALYSHVLRTLDSITDFYDSM